MERDFECPCCGEEISVLVDADSGDYQEFGIVCEYCEEEHIVAASFDYHSGRYDIAIHHAVTR